MPNANAPSKKILLYPIGVLVFFILSWFVGGTEPVTSSHALSFLLHQDGTIFLPLLIFAIVSVIIVTEKTLVGNDYFEVYRWPYLVSIILVAAALFMFLITRYNAANDPNVIERFSEYASSEGWLK